MNPVKHIVLVLLVLVFCGVGEAAPTGLKVPDVPVTGGKRATRWRDGNVVNVQPMPGLTDPKIITWDELTQKYFDPKRTIPHPRPQELVHQAGLFKSTTQRTVDLPRVMEMLTRKSFADPKYGAREPWVQSFGNIIAEFKKIKANARATDDLLAKLEKKYPVIYSEISPYLLQLVRDDFLYSSKWDPYKDESVKGKQNDGILFVDDWVMQPDPTRHAVWNQDIGEHKGHQGATIIYADVETIKEMEFDYASYFSQIGQHYLEVYPIQGSYFKGIDPRGNEFVRMQLFLRNGLPFPYDSASYVMNILERYDENGHLLTEYYSEDKEDLNWMAGRDTYLEVRTTDGTLVGNMIVTTLDLDIKNVPERDIDRIISMKAGLGNMKRMSEDLLTKKNVARP